MAVTILVTLLISLVSSRAHAEPQVIIAEDFDKYPDVAALNGAWPGGTAQLTILASGHGQAVLHDGAQMNNSGPFAISPDALHDIFLSADFYDFATNLSKKITVNLRHGAKLNLDIGVVNGNIFCVRAQGFCTRSNWIPIASSQPVTPCWRRITVVLSLTNMCVTLLSTNPQPLGVVNVPVLDVPIVFKQLRFGGVNGKPCVGGPALIDNIELALVDKSATAAALAATPLPDAPSIGTASQPAAKRQPGSSAEVESEPKTAGVAARSFDMARPNAGGSIAGWLLASLAMIILLLMALLFTFVRAYGSNQKNWSAMAAAPGLPALRERNDNQALAVSRENDWRSRALAAEAMATRQAQLLKEKVGPELIEFAKESLVQGLYNQRNSLVETQKRAEEALNELESRLTELHLPHAQRVEEYQKRIAELETQLESRTEEMREITRATLALVRERLEKEKTGDLN